MPRLFQSLSHKYLRSLRAALGSTEATPELSFRPFLDTFLRKFAADVSPDISVVHEPRKQSKAGRPDWRFHNRRTLGVYGYVEAKPLNLAAEMAIAPHQQQIENYLALGQKLVVTDGIEFLFYSPARKPPERVSLVRKPVRFDRAEPNPALEQRLREFLAEARPRRCSEYELIEEIAKRAKWLSRSIEELIDLTPGAAADETEQRTIVALTDLKRLVEKHRDPLLRTPKAVADFIAQVLVFGLLYAHRVIRGERDTPAERYEKIQRFWSDVVYRPFTEELRPFRALIDSFSEEVGVLGPVGSPYDDCRLLLAHIELQEEQRKRPDYHTLYERFLAIFDPQTRFDFGAFYTPPALADYAVNFTEAILNAGYPELDLYAAQNKLIDPCCGTGTFLERLLDHAESHPYPPRIIGFEILPAPYALAHYRLAMLRPRLKDPKKVAVMLTNTLSDHLEGPAGGDRTGSPLEEEQKLARDLARPPLTLVIGNPPSSDAPSRSRGPGFKIIERLLEDFRPPRSLRRVRQNVQKQLQNEFVKFLRWACNKLMQTEIGVLTMVLPASFAEHPSYRYARKWLVGRLRDLWVLDLDLDGRTGVPAASLFHTLQGRLLLVGVTTKGSVPSGQATVRYAAITDLSSDEKTEYLSCQRDPSHYQTIEVDSTTYSLRRSRAYNRKLYTRFWPLHPTSSSPATDERFIFHRHSSCVKLAPSGMLIHARRDVLLRRCRDIADSDKRYDDLRTKWFSGQDKPPARSKFGPAIRWAIGDAIGKTRPPVRLYAYRPFTTVHALIDEPVLRELSRTAGGGTRYRPEVLAAYRSRKTFGFAVAPAPKDLGDRLHRFASFCWHVPDNDLCKRGNAHVFCNQFPEYKKPGASGWDPRPKPNVNESLLERLSSELGIAERDAVDRLVFYAYAILCSDAYLDAFEGALFTVAGSLGGPRLPICADRRLFEQIAQTGRKLAALEDPRMPVEPPEWIRKLEHDFPQEFRLTDYGVDLPGEKLELREDGIPKVALKPVPGEVLRFQVSGYSVIKQWLKLWSYPYSRTTFGQRDFKALLDLMARIELQTRTVRELDSAVGPLLAGQAALIV